MENTEPKSPDLFSATNSDIEHPSQLPSTSSKFEAYADMVRQTKQHLRKKVTPQASSEFNGETSLEQIKIELKTREEQKKKNIHESYSGSFSSFSNDSRQSALEKQQNSNGNSMPFNFQIPQFRKHVKIGAQTPTTGKEPTSAGLPKTSETQSPQTTRQRTTDKTKSFKPHEQRRRSSRFTWQSRNTQVQMPFDRSLSSVVRPAKKVSDLSLKDFHKLDDNPRAQLNKSLTSHQILTMKPLTKSLSQRKSSRHPHQKPRSPTKVTETLSDGSSYELSDYEESQFSWDKSSSSDNDDEPNDFWNSLENVRQGFTLSKDSLFFRVASLFGIVFSFCSSFIYAYYTAFLREEDPDQVQRYAIINGVCTFFFSFDWLVYTLLNEHNPKKEGKWTMRKTCMKQIKGRLIFDLVTTLPLETLVERYITGEAVKLRWLKIFRITRCYAFFDLRIYKRVLWEIRNFKEDRLEVGHDSNLNFMKIIDFSGVLTLVKLARLVSVAVIAAYFFGIVFYCLSLHFGEGNDLNFISTYFTEKTNSEIILALLYFVISILTKACLPNYLPQNSHERIVAAGFLLFGAIICTWMTLQLSDLFVQYFRDGMDDPDELSRLGQFHHLIRKLNSDRPFSARFEAKMNEYFLFREKHFKYDRRLFQKLQPNIQKIVLLAYLEKRFVQKFRPIFEIRLTKTGFKRQQFYNLRTALMESALSNQSQLPPDALQFFDSYHEEMILALASSLEPLNVKPKAALLKPNGEEPSEIYFCMNGAIEVGYNLKRFVFETRKDEVHVPLAPTNRRFEEVQRSIAHFLVDQVQDLHTIEERYRFPIILKECQPVGLFELMFSCDSEYLYRFLPNRSKTERADYEQAPVLFIRGTVFKQIMRRFKESKSAVFPTFKSQVLEAYFKNVYSPMAQSQQRWMNRCSFVVYEKMGITEEANKHLIRKIRGEEDLITPKMFPSNSEIMMGASQTMYGFGSHLLLEPPKTDTQLTIQANTIKSFDMFIELLLQKRLNPLFSYKQSFKLMLMKELNSSKPSSRELLRIFAEMFQELTENAEELAKNFDILYKNAMAITHKYHKQRYDLMLNFKTIHTLREQQWKLKGEKEALEDKVKELQKKLSAFASPPSVKQFSNKNYSALDLMNNNMTFIEKQKFLSGSKSSEHNVPPEAMYKYRLVQPTTNYLHPQSMLSSDSSLSKIDSSPAFRSQSPPEPSFGRAQPQTAPTGTTRQMEIHSPYLQGSSNQPGIQLPQGNQIHGRNEIGAGVVQFAIHPISIMSKSSSSNSQVTLNSTSIAAGTGGGPSKRPIPHERVSSSEDEDESHYSMGSSQTTEKVSNSRSDISSFCGQNSGIRVSSQGSSEEEKKKSDEEVSDMTSVNNSSVGKKPSIININFDNGAYVISTAATGKLKIQVDSPKKQKKTNELNLVLTSPPAKKRNAEKKKISLHQLQKHLKNNRHKKPSKKVSPEKTQEPPLTRKRHIVQPQERTAPQRKNISTNMVVQPTSSQSPERILVQPRGTNLRNLKSLTKSSHFKINTFEEYLVEQDLPNFRLAEEDGMESTPTIHHERTFSKPASLTTSSIQEDLSHYEGLDTPKNISPKSIQNPFQFQGTMMDSRSIRESILVNSIYNTSEQAPVLNLMSIQPTIDEEIVIMRTRQTSGPLNVSNRESNLSAGLESDSAIDMGGLKQKGKRAIARRRDLEQQSLGQSDHHSSSSVDQTSSASSFSLNMRKNKSLKKKPDIF